VSAIEKATGRSAEITILNALRPKSENEVASARARLDALFATRDSGGPVGESPVPEGSTTVEVAARRVDTGFGAEALALVERSRGLLDRMHEEDTEEAIALHERIQDAVAGADAGALAEAEEELRELLFFVEAR
jgi:hypothetical protein